MKVFRFWARREERCTDPEGFDFRLVAWGGSNVDATAADAEARTRLDRWLSLVRSGMDAFHEAVDYPYGEDQLREELLDGELADAGLGWAITRTRYGAEVLNATQLAMLDIDLRDRGFAAWLRSLFKSRATLEAGRIALVRSWVAANPDAGVRLYRTPAGFRAILTHRRFDPGSDEIAVIMRALHVDPLFARLCRRQACFRARLTAKPWRLGIRRVCWNPVAEGEIRSDADRRWLAGYEAKARDYAACAWIADIGSASIDDREIAALVQLHDERARASSKLPLA